MKIELLTKNQMNNEMNERFQKFRGAQIVTIRYLERKIHQLEENQRALEQKLISLELKL